MAGGNPGPIWVRGPFLLASGLFLLHGANGGTRGKRQPPACPGPGRQAQSRNSALTQMTQGISGSGARRWSVRKPCRAAQVQESSARCVLYRGGGGKRTAGPRRSRGPAGSVPRRLFGPFLDVQKGTRPAGRAPPALEKGQAIVVHLHLPSAPTGQLQLDLSGSAAFPLP